MDPNATLRMFLEACADYHNGTGTPFPAAAVWALQDLHDWIERGGMIPHVVTAKPDVFDGVVDAYVVAL